MCEGRKYEYIIPSFCFEKNPNFQDFRIEKEKEEKILKLLSHFEGTLNYHNFTKYIDSDKSKDYFKSMKKFKIIISKDT
jgi:tRNA U38,U39,U40 pseudouridine synthase TruA